MNWVRFHMILFEFGHCSPMCVVRCFAHWLDISYVISIKMWTFLANAASPLRSYLLINFWTVFTEIDETKQGAIWCSKKTVGDTTPRGCQAVLDQSPWYMSDKGMIPVTIKSCINCIHFIIHSFWFLYFTFWIGTGWNREKCMRHCLQYYDVLQREQSEIQNLKKKHF